MPPRLLALIFYENKALDASRKDFVKPAQGGDFQSGISPTLTTANKAKGPKESVPTYYGAVTCAPFARINNTVETNFWLSRPPTHFVAHML